MRRGPEDEVDVSPFVGPPQRDSPREQFFTLEEQQSEFVRLKQLRSNADVDDNVLSAQAGQNLATPRTRGLEGLGGSVATDEFEPGTAFVPIDREIRLGDLFGGLNPESRLDLDVQIGPSEAEIDAGAPPVLPMEEAILFRRLRPLHPGMDHDELMLRVRRLVRASRTRGIEGLPLDEVIAEFDPTTNRRFTDNDALEIAARRARDLGLSLAHCIASGLPPSAGAEYLATGKVSRPDRFSLLVSAAQCLGQEAMKRPG